MHPQTSKRAYLTLCVAVSLLGYLPFVIYEGTLLDIPGLTGIVLGAYCTIELIRAASARWLRLLLFIWLTPYAVVIGIGLYAGVRMAVAYVSRFFAT